MKNRLYALQLSTKSCFSHLTHYFVKELTLHYAIESIKGGYYDNTVVSHLIFQASEASTAHTHRIFFLIPSYEAEYHGVVIEARLQIDPVEVDRVAILRAATNTCPHATGDHTHISVYK